MIRRPPRSTLDRSSAASDVYKRQFVSSYAESADQARATGGGNRPAAKLFAFVDVGDAVSYTHLGAHETVLDLVCRLLLEKKKNKNMYILTSQ